MSRKRPKALKRKRPPPTLAKLKKTAWGLLSEATRREASDVDGWVACYTCGAVQQWNRGTQAGHAIGGRDGAVLLNEEIIRPQCVHCNIFLNGNYGVFATKLIKEHGMDWWDAKNAESRQVVKWSRSDLEEKIDSYKARLSALGI